MKFRPCIDLHNGVVKQIVGSTLSDQDSQNPVTNFTSKHPPEWYALKYKEDNLTGGHVIQLGKAMNQRQKQRWKHGREACKSEEASILIMLPHGLIMGHPQLL
jgi:phosphoribosylformimino-5-aminoimidazole carboxamide ribonucleotide (ProFAR) isomerase